MFKSIIFTYSFEIIFHLKIIRLYSLHYKYFCVANEFSKRQASSHPQQHNNNSMIFLSLSLFSNFIFSLFQSTACRPASPQSNKNMNAAARTSNEQKSLFHTFPLCFVDFQPAPNCAATSSSMEQIQNSIQFALDPKYS